MTITATDATVRALFAISAAKVNPLAGVVVALTAEAIMTSDDLHAVLDGPKHIEWLRDEQDPSAGLRLLITDPASNSVGILAIEPMALVLPDEVVLDYSWHELSTDLGPPPEECLIPDLKTNVAPAYEKGEVPFLF